MTARLFPKNLASREEPNYGVATMTAWRRSNDFAWMILCDAHHSSKNSAQLNVAENEGRRLAVDNRKSLMRQRACTENCRK
jgi:hypothetical protein